MKPSRMVISMINMVTNLIPSWKSIIHGPDILNSAIKLPEKRHEVLLLSFGYKIRDFVFGNQ